jgi:outer membrane protein TolC
MVAFDTLSYARRLKQAGVPDAQAEAMADATRELVVADFATKADIAALKADIGAARGEISAAEQRVMTAMDTLGLRLTVRLGGLIAVGVAILAAIIKL